MEKRYTFVRLSPFNRLNFSTFTYNKTRTQCPHLTWCLYIIIIINVLFVRLDYYYTLILDFPGDQLGAGDQDHIFEYSRHVHVWSSKLSRRMYEVIPYWILSIASYILHNRHFQIWFPYDYIASINSLE